MSWTSLKETAPKSSGDYLKLEDGANKIRIVTPPTVAGKHWIGNKAVWCVGKDSGCAGCQAEDPKARYLFNVIDRKDGKIKLAEFGWSIVDAIIGFQESEDYGFKAEDLPPYDLTINKTGKGLETEYTVLPARQNTLLTPAEQSEVAALKPISEFVEAMKGKAPKVDPSTIPFGEEFPSALNG